MSKLKWEIGHSSCWITSRWVVLGVSNACSHDRILDGVFFFTGFYWLCGKKTTKPWKQLACINEMFLRHVTEDKVDIFWRESFGCFKCRLKMKRIHAPFKMVFFSPLIKLELVLAKVMIKNKNTLKAPMFLFNIVSQFIISSQGVQCAGDFVSVDLFFTKQKYMQNP